MTTLSSNQTALQIQPACVPPPTRLSVSSSQTASQIQSDCVPPPARLPVSSNQTASHFQSDCLSAPTRLHPTSNQTASTSNQCACQLQPDCLSDPIRLPLSSNFCPLSAHSSERLKIQVAQIQLIYHKTPDHKQLLSPLRDGLVKRTRVREKIACCIENQRARGSRTTDMPTAFDLLRQASLALTVVFFSLSYYHVHLFVLCSYLKSTGSLSNNRAV